MKRCSMCGEIYDDRVDFCFDDGTPLEAIPEEKEAAISAPESGIDLAGLDAPDPENISGLDAPDPMGVDWSNDPVPVLDQEEPEAAPSAAAPVAATIPEAPTPDSAVHTVETEVSDGTGQMPAGFGEPPSQLEAGESLAEDEFWDGNDDDLDFPDEFGTGEGTFGQEYTDPTIPLPSRPGGGGAKKAVAGVMLAVVALLAFALSRGGDSEEEPADTVAATELQKPIREIEEPRSGPNPLPDVVAEPEVPAEEVDDTPEEEIEPVEEPEPEPAEAEDVQVEAEPEVEPVARPREAAVSRPVTPAQPVEEEVEEPADQNVVSEVDPWATAQPEVATSRVRVFSKPSGASLYVDGRAYGSTPAELDLDQGQHSIRVEKEGYFSESRTVSISGATHLERFEMRAESQRVTVNCYGPDSSKVYLDGKVICAIPGSGTVTTGEHTFRVVTPDRFYRKVINVQRKSDGSPTPLRFTE